MKLSQKILLLMFCSFLWCLTGCFIPRVQVGPALLNPVKHFKKEVVAPQKPDDTQYSVGFDIMMAIHIPIMEGKDLFKKVKIKRNKRSGTGFKADIGPGLWASTELGFSLDSAGYQGKFLAGLGLSYRLGEMLAIGYTPYLMLGGTELGLQIGMRHALTFYLFYSILFVEPQYEFSLGNSGLINSFRIMVGVNLFAPFILLARKNI